MSVETVESHFVVTGLNCGGCVTTLTRKAMGIYGVVHVDVDLVPKGESDVTIRHARDVDERAIEVRLEEVGYRVLRPVPVHEG